MYVCVTSIHMISINIYTTIYVIKVYEKTYILARPLLQIYEALLQIYETLLRIYETLLRIYKLFCRYMRLLCRCMRLFCRYMKLFCMYMRLFCRCKRLFCRYMRLFCGHITSGCMLYMCVMSTDMIFICHYFNVHTSFLGVWVHVPLSLHICIYIHLGQASFADI